MAPLSQAIIRFGVESSPAPTRTPMAAAAATPPKPTRAATATVGGSSRGLWVHDHLGPAFISIVEMLVRGGRFVQGYFV